MNDSRAILTLAQKQGQCPVKHRFGENEIGRKVVQGYLQTSCLRRKPGQKEILNSEFKPLKRLFLMNFWMFREKLRRLYICLRKQWNEGCSGSFDRRLECVSRLDENLMAVLHKDSR
jgi:hypothetical protein